MHALSQLHTFTIIHHDSTWFLMNLIGARLARDCWGPTLEGSLKKRWEKVEERMFFCCQKLCVLLCGLWNWRPSSWLISVHWNPKSDVVVENQNWHSPCSDDKHFSMHHPQEAICQWFMNAQLVVPCVYKNLLSGNTET